MSELQCVAVEAPRMAWWGSREGIVLAPARWPAKPPRPLRPTPAEKPE